MVKYGVEMPIKRLAQTIKNALPDTPAGKSNPLVALDIGTENVKALIVEVQDGQLKVLGAGRSHQGYNDMQAGAIADIPAAVA